MTVKEVAAFLRAHDSYLILTHRRPDGDTVGSAFALYYALQMLGKEVRVLCADPLPEMYRYLYPDYTPSRVLEWPVVVSPEGTAPRQHSDALVQSQGCKIPSGCIETLSASLSRQLTVEYDYVWFVPSGAVKDDLRHATLVALPVPGHGAGEPIGILTRVDATFSSGCQLMINAIRKSMPF